MSDAAAQVEAAKKALEQAQAALAAAEQQAAEAAQAALAAAEQQAAEAAQAAQAAAAEATEAAAAAAAAEAEVAAAPAETAPAAPADPTPGPLAEHEVDAIRAGYAMSGPVLEMGALVNGDPRADVPIRIPLAMTNRHGLVAGATGTGKTKTLQGLAEQLSAAGVPVFAADIKGDLSGIAVAGEPSEKLLARTAGIGQPWAPAACPTEFLALGGIGHGVPVRATVSSFGPLLLSKVLGLNDTQESSLGLVFHYADTQGLALVDLDDLRAVIQYLISDEGKPALAELGGLAKATAGVILRELVAFAAQGADVFFGEPEFDTADVLRLAPDGRGIVSLLEVPGVADRPALFSTFLMWMLADLFNDLPQVGDLDKPKLVFFFDEAHLLFRDASKDFLAAITQTVRLIRSKGVGIFFVTQTPKDVPSDVLAQLGSRIQHQLRAHTPDDAKALRATVSTYPSSGYDLGEVLTTLGIGEAIVTVMNEKGAPSPVAWTRLRAPQGSMDAAPEPVITQVIAASPLLPAYGTAVDRESAHEILSARMNAAAEAEAARELEAEAAKERARLEKEAASAATAEAKRQAKAQADYERTLRDLERRGRTTTRTPTRRTGGTGGGTAGSGAGGLGDLLGGALGSRAGQTIVREVLRGVFGTLKRR